MEGNNANRRERVDNSSTERPPVWRQTPVPSPQGRYICFRAGHDDTTNLYSIPIDDCEDDFSYSLTGGGGGEAVGLKPFNRSTFSTAATFAGVGTSLFCMGGLEAPNGEAYEKPTSNLYQFDSTDAEGGWRTLKMLSCRVLPISIAMDGKLYIFNGWADEDPSHPWAEVFDPSWDSSLSFPLPPLVGRPRRCSEFVYAALHSSKRILVASTTFNVAYVYHVVDGDWKQLDHNIDFTGHVVKDQAAVVRNTTLCWYRDTVHQLEAYDLDLKRWFNCPVEGLEKVGVLSPSYIPTYFSLFPMDDNHLCLLWMDHCYACTRYRYGLLHCTKIRVSIKAGTQGEHGFNAFVVSSTSYVLDEGVFLLGNDACVLYGEKDEGCTEAVDVTGANWVPVRGSCSSEGGCGVGYSFNHGESFNRGERVEECGSHDHAGRTRGLGGNGGGRRNACFKCGVTGHMARDCYPVGGSGGGRYLSGSGSCGGGRGGGLYTYVEKRIPPKNAINAAS